MLLTLMVPDGYTVDDIVTIYRVRPGYVYKLACLRRWRRYRSRGRVCYHPDDVDAALGGHAT